MRLPAERWVIEEWVSGNGLTPEAYVSWVLQDVFVQPDQEDDKSVQVKRPEWGGNM